MYKNNGALLKPNGNQTNDAHSVFQKGTFTEMTLETQNMELPYICNMLFVTVMYNLSFN